MLGLLLGLGPRLKFDVFQQNTIMYPVGVRLKTCYIMNTRKKLLLDVKYCVVFFR